MCWGQIVRQQARLAVPPVSHTDANSATPQKSPKREGAQTLLARKNIPGVQVGVLPC
jgi:hypothetical protein